VYGLAPDDVRSLLLTFYRTFRHVTVFAPNTADLIVLGSDEPIDLADAHLVEICTADAAIARDLTRAGIPSVTHLLATYLMHDGRIADFVAGATTNTDDNMRIEHAAPFQLVAATDADNARLLFAHGRVPAFAASSADVLAALSQRYVEMTDWRRAVAAMELAAERDGALAMDAESLRQKAIAVAGGERFEPR
jgi:hypothetical protein